MTLRDLLVERAAEQHGYVTTRDAQEIGVDPAQLRLMAARGRLVRVARGVYRVELLPRGEFDDLAAAVAWSLGRGVISHASALTLHRLSDVNPAWIHLTVPRENYPRAAGGHLYRLHRRLVPAEDVTKVDNIPVTTVARTIHDCLEGGVDSRQIRRAVDDAEIAGRLDRVAVRRFRQVLNSRARSVDSGT